MPSRLAHKKVRLEIDAGVDPVPVEIPHAVREQERVIDQEIAGDGLRVLEEYIACAASARMSGVREARMTASPRNFLIAEVAMVVRGQSALTAMPRAMFTAPMNGRAC